MARRVVGGVFGLESPGSEAAPPPFAQAGPALWTVNGRSAILALSSALRPRAAWLPSYLCEAVLQGLGSATTVRYYDVGSDLHIRERAWLELVEPDDLVVVVDYFGFPAPGDVAASARARGACVLEDACQALLTEGLGREADFLVFSPRKFVGVPDGGVLVQTGRRPLPTPILSPPPLRWWQGALTAAEGRRDFDRGAGARGWFAAFQASERDAPTGAYAASELTRSLLSSAVGWAAVVEARRRNWEALAAALGDVALFRELPAGVAPLGFPVQMRARDEVRDVLFANEIYPPVHWPIRGIVPDSFAASQRLAEEIMTLPCDQRYEPADMERMAALVRGAIA